MHSKSIGPPSGAVALSISRHHRPVADRQPPAFSRKAIPADAARAVRAVNGVPVSTISGKISEILWRCKLRPGETMPVRIDGVDKVLGRTAAGDRLALQTEDEFRRGASNGIFFGQEGMVGTMMIDGHYLTSMSDPALANAQRVVEEIHAVVKSRGSSA